ncbi:MAG: lipoyl synthase [Krumholzibacteria bacterium]|nr:lipoyl synthase [Candidatus Krumholzibacteria bacterium]
MKNDGLIPELGRAPLPARKPAWLRMERQGGAEYNEVKRLLRSAALHTVCESANCPNRGECFGSRTATFLLMGDVCTRHCTFCNIPGGRAGALDPDEPRRVAETVRTLGLKFAVCTSVNRDDLPDGGAEHFAQTIRQIRALNPGCGVEVLIPDFMGDHGALEVVLREAPEVLNHNLETVPRLYPMLRTGADYRRSLAVLRAARDWSDARGGAIKVKTGIMLGVGESGGQVVELMRDAVAAGVQIMTIGQYLQPSGRHHPVRRYVEPQEFDRLAAIGRELGIGWVEAGPMVRSSYHAREQSETLAQGPSPVGPDPAP